MAIGTLTAMLPAVGEVVKSATAVLGLVKDTETKQKVIELHTTIFALQDRIRAAQIEQDDLIESKCELERKLLEYDNWESEAAQYELRSLAEGIFVYALKSRPELSAPEHYLCPNCFMEKKRSILQHPQAGSTKYVCHACKMEICPVASSFHYQSVPRRNSFRGLMG